MIKRENLIQYIIIITIVVIVPLFALSANQNNNTDSFLKDVYCKTLGKWFNDSYCTKVDVIENSTNPSTTLGVNNQVPNTNKSTLTSTSITQTKSTLSFNKTPNNTNPLTSFEVNNQLLTTDNQNTSPTSPTSQQPFNLPFSLSNFVTHDFLSRQAGSLGDSFGRSLGNLSTQLTALIPSTASISNWDSFFTTPSTRITAGTGLSWSGNTLSATGGSAGDFTLATWYATTTNALAEGLNNLYYTDTRVNTYLNASTTLPKSYSNNTFTGNNIFNGNLTLGTLNGPLQANNGLVSATTSIGVLYGGTGATTFGQGWLYSSGGTSALQSSTSPTVAYITATSTTATSTFAGGLNVAGSSGLTVMQNGYVGVGTNKPIFPVTIKGATTTPYFMIEDTDGSELLRIHSDFSTNLFIGKQAGSANTPISTTEGEQNTFIGSAAGQKNTTGYASVNLGFAAGYNDTIGRTNTNLGYQAGYLNVSGNENTNVGVDAGAANTTDSNIFMGFHSGGSFSVPITGSKNIFIGNETAVGATSIHDNSSLGYRAGYSITSGYDNTFMGSLTGFSVSEGYQNVLIGKEAGTTLTTGYHNVFVGYRAGYSLQTNKYHNTGVGDTALFSLTTGLQNTSLGSGSGFSLTTGTLNTFLGYNAGNNASQLISASNSTAIGNGAYTTASNQVVIGNISVTSTLLNGSVGISTTSPWARLSVAGASLGTIPLFTVSTSTASATSTAFIINSNGKVGIGTTTPSATLGLAGNMYLSGSATSTIEGNLDVKSALHALTSYTGDLFFANNFSFTESQPIDSIATQSLIMKNQNGNKIMDIDDKGNLNITGDICSKNVICVNESLNKLSADLGTLASSTLGIQNGINGIKNTPSSVQSLADAIVTLDLKVEALIASSTMNVDLLIASTSSTLASNADFINKISSSTATVLSSDTASVESLANAIINVIAQAGELVLNKIIATLGVFESVETKTITSDLVKSKSIDTSTIKTQTISISDGFQMIDKITGQIYCISLKNGDWDKTLGQCSEMSMATSSIIKIVEKPIITTLPSPEPVITNLPLSTSTPENQTEETSTTSSINGNIIEVISTLKPTPESSPVSETVGVEEPKVSETITPTEITNEFSP